MRIYPLLAIIFVALLAGCASAPRQTRNICAVFDQRDGLFDSWESASERTSRKYGIPVPILMATMYVESGFQPYAKTRRRYVLGFIPWGRVSTAYGYSQALNGTWDHYRAATGNWNARRSNFYDAVDFIGWYHAQNSLKTGIPRNDAYSLYLAYYSGPRGYLNGSWRSDAGLQRTARKFAGMAALYQQQIRSGC
ncbi:transglycosylase SLT domain-containing protein [Oryzifoliimicrobium ureilyticus]|uniref:transglycosylase SLT domain-containing protein n=1 Tax=Oryzifoliimicrobium ureilyticus TaxID=3113724 RepID=UPI00307679EE